jgi:two-component system, OmpR family, phosphate regulon sensor histidine kinase PhoR
MQKKSIWTIIGLMTAALIGTIGLQVYWINWYIKLNQEQFDKDVFEALNRVSEKLQYEENAIALEALRSGNPQKSPLFNQDIITQFKSEGSGLTLALKMLKKNVSTDTVTNIWDLMRTEKDFSQKERYLEAIKMLSPVPIAERIDLKHLNGFIRSELENHGIQLKYNYGVYENKRKSFVISNGKYTVEDRSPHVSTAGQGNLYSSQYRVQLFPHDIQSPGLLMLHFPSRAGQIWSSVIKALIASILFTGLVIFCFAYTVIVIFRQKKLSEMKSDFINNMTHEFKTPIATISLAADSITSPSIISHQDKIKRFIEIIKQENKRMNAQVEKVLQMALLDRNEYNLKITSLNLHQIIDAAVANFSLVVDKREGIIIKKLEAENPLIEGDITHVTNMITNLMDNANKYSPDKPEITISTKNVPNGVEITVKDLGIGLSKEARKQIFDKFYRVSTGNLHNVKGFGLGLSYVKAMITAHKGQVDVKSEPGKGSSFILFFPFQHGG